MSDEELDRIALEIYWHLERGEASQARVKLLSVRPPELEELRRFKAAALTLTSEASVQHVMDGPYLKNAILVHHTGQSITSADVEEAMSKEKT